MKKRDRFRKIISKFRNAKILVIGDLMLDEFLWGNVSRISPEAPVPVVRVRSESFMPGGAANVANNIHALGATVHMAGVVGIDERGRILKGELEKKGLNVAGIVLDGERPTTLKTRVIAHHQQVVRIDRENSGELSGGAVDQIIDYVKEVIDDIDAIIIEDYGKGVIAPRVLQDVLRLAKRHKKIVTVDPKEEHFHYYKGVTAITPNHHEAANAVGMKIKDESSLVKIGKALLNRLKCEAALMTLGENGMQLFEKSGRITCIPTVAQDVFDVSGAGDTVIGAFTLALAAGASMTEAAHISNFAAGIVVGKVGIAVVTQEELTRAMRRV